MEVWWKIIIVNSGLGGVGRWWKIIIMNSGLDGVGRWWRFGGR